MRAVHLAVGGVGLIVFFATGLYMRSKFPASYESNETIRYLYRASHNYILYVALLNLAVGTYLLRPVSGWRRRVQGVGSILLLLAPLLLVWAFFVEPPLAVPERPRTALGAACTLAGTLLHVLAGAMSRSREE